MRTRYSNFPNNSNLTIPRRQIKGRAPNVVKPELRTIVEIAPMVERTMEELLRAPMEGYGEAIVLPEINADHFEINTNLLQLVQACPFHVDTFYNGLNENDQGSLNAAADGNLLSKTTREALNIIKNKSKVRYSRNKSNVSRMNTTSRESVSKTDERIDKLADQISTLVEIVSKKVVTPAPVKAVEEICVTCSGPHAWYNCPNTDNNQSSVCAAMGTYNQVNPPNRVSNQMAPPSFAQVQNNGQNSGFFQNQASTSGTLPSNTIPNPKGEMKAITTRSGVAYEGPLIPTNPSPKKTLPKLNIPYPSRRNDQKSRKKASNLIEKIFQIFQDLRFDISFADALLLMPRFAPTIKNLLMNKEKLLELAKIPLNENCSAMLLKKLPEKLRDPDKFLIPSDPRVPLILGRSFLRTDRALVDVYEGELILRDGDERLIFHVDKHPQKHANESIKMINSIDVSCEDSFGEVLRLKKSNHFLSGSTTSLSDSSPSLTSFETSDSLLEEFADELTLLDLFPLGNEDVDVEAELREIELLLNRDPSTNFSPTITIDPNPEKFTDEFAPACLPPPGDDDDDESFLKEDMLEDVESKDSNVSNFNEPVLLNTPLFDEDDCFNPGGNIDEIYAFLAIEVSTKIEEGYYDSKGDVFYLESLLSDDTTHNLFPEVLFNHEPQCFKDESELDTLENIIKVLIPGSGRKLFLHRV
ncbi:hypothetical protein Tco_0780661 [Tanacetum coccineum]